MTPQDQCAALFSDALRTGADLGPALQALLELTGARAAGFWILRDGALRQRGFRAVESMPQSVQQEFAAATKTVPLDRIGLGIVKAVVDRQPTVMTRERGGRDPNASPSWLDRFECQQSLVIPLLHEGEAVAAIAVSAEAPLSPDHANWKTMAMIAAAIAADAGSVARTTEAK